MGVYPSNCMRDDLGRCIVKRFPRGYTIRSYSMQKAITPCECWMIVEHLGKDKDGLEFFIAPTGRHHKTMLDAISELKWMRDGIHE